MVHLLNLLAAIALLFMAIAGAVAFWSGPGSKESLVAVLALPMIPYLVFICLVAMMAGIWSFSQSVQAGTANLQYLN